MKFCSDSEEKQDREEMELLAMETQEDMDYDVDSETENELMGEINESHMDSPWPSDNEESDEEEGEFVITDCLMDKSITTENESVIPVNELANRMKDLQSGDSLSPPAATSSPTNISLSGQKLVANGCNGHCGCLSCTKCMYCAVCESCTTCTKCSNCKYPPKSLFVSAGPARKVVSREIQKLKIAPEKVRGSNVLKQKSNIVVGQSKNKDLETKCVGDKKVETKCVGDKSKPMLVKSVMETSTKKDEKSNIDKVSKLLGINLRFAPSRLNPKQVKSNRFCQRRILITNRRLEIQRDFRQGGIIDQHGIIKLLVDNDFWVQISLVGYTDIWIPRSGANLIGYLNFCPFITWAVVDVDGDICPDGLMFVGEFLKTHLNPDYYVSKNRIRFCPVQKPTRRPSDQPSEAKPSQIPRLDGTTNSGQLTPSISNTPSPNIRPDVNVQRSRLGFPNEAPVFERPGVLRWRDGDRNQGTPISRRRDHVARRNRMPNVGVNRNGQKQLIHNGRTQDRVNEEREMLFVCS